MNRVFAINFIIRVNKNVFLFLIKNIYIYLLSLLITIILIISQFIHYINKKYFN